jgi:SAM-dependent methyltransferase
MNTYYGTLCSWFYDIDKPYPNNDELDFYLSFANKNIDILEPMCGSGRFLIEFIEHGYKIDGFDISNDMLNRCKQKIQSKNGKCNLQCCDFSNYHTDKYYDFIFIPSGSFSLIINHKDIINNLNILRDLCKNNGRIVIELEITNNINNGKKYYMNKTVKDKNFEISFSYKTIDERENIIYSICKYELFKKGKNIKTEEDPFNIKYYLPNEFEAYLKETDMKIQNKYINYNKEKYIGQETEKIIYELKNYT